VCIKIEYFCVQSVLLIYFSYQVLRLVYGNSVIDIHEMKLTLATEIVLVVVQGQCLVLRRHAD